MNKYHASDAVKIAQNWAFAAQIDPEEIAVGGVNKIRMAIDEVINGKKKAPKQGPATSGTSKKSKKSATVSAQSIVDNALATAAKHNIKIADVLLTLKNTLEKTAKK